MMNRFLSTLACLGIVGATTFGNSAPKDPLSDNECHRELAPYIVRAISDPRLLSKGLELDKEKIARVQAVLSGCVLDRRFHTDAKDKKAIAEVLTEKQQKRLDELVWQVRGLLDQEVQKKLKLEDEQKMKMLTHQKKSAEAEAEYYKEVVKGGIGGVMGMDKSKIAQFRKDLEKKCADVLSEEQQKTWRGMAGEPAAAVFDVWISTKGKMRMTPSCPVVVRILLNEDLQADLALDKDQKAKFDDLAERILTDLPQREQVRSLDILKQLEIELEAAQIKRVKKFIIFIRGLDDPSNQQLLNLTDEQCEECKKLAKKFQRTQRELFQGKVDVTREERLEKTADLYVLSQAAMAKLLDKKQLEQWKDITDSSYVIPIAYRDMYQENRLAHLVK